MPDQILVVDDEPLYLRLMEANLATEGYEVLKAYDGLQAVQIVAEKKPDLVLLDLMMPLLDGFEACKRIREFSDIPIIIITAKGEEQDRVRGLDLGADDYIVKPFSANELLARVRAALRRSKKSGRLGTDVVFQHSDLRIDYAHAEVFVDDKMIFLSATEYRILLQLAHNVGRTVSSGQLLIAIWGDEYADDKEILWVSVSRLRQKIEKDPRNPQHIVTRAGEGYIMPLLDA